MVDVLVAVHQISALTPPQAPPTFIGAQRQIIISLLTSGAIIKDWVCLWLKNQLLFSLSLSLCASCKLVSVYSRELNRPWTQLHVYLLSSESWKVCREPHSMFNLSFYKKGAFRVLEPARCSWCAYMFRSLAEEVLPESRFLLWGFSLKRINVQWLNS